MYVLAASTPSHGLELPFAGARSARSATTRSAIASTNAGGISKTKGWPLMRPPPRGVVQRLHGVHVVLRVRRRLGRGQCSTSATSSTCGAGPRGLDAGASDRPADVETRTLRAGAPASGRRTWSAERAPFRGGRVPVLQR